MNVRLLGPEAEHHLSSLVWQALLSPGRDWSLKSLPFQHARAAARIAAIEKVHPHVADEAGDKKIGRVLVELDGSSDLPEDARAEHGDAVGHRKRIHLVVGDHDHRRAELALKAAQLGPHGLAQACVQVADRFVKQIQVRLLDDGAADRHALLLAAADLLHRPVEELLDAEQPGRVFHPAVGVFARDVADLQGIGEIVAYGEMGIEGIALEHHPDMPLAGREPRDFLAADPDLAVIESLQSGDDAHQGRFAAAGRAQEAKQLAVGDFEVEFAEELGAAKALADLAQTDVRHAGLTISPRSHIRRRPG